MDVNSVSHRNVNWQLLVVAHAGPVDDAVHTEGQADVVLMASDVVVVVSVEMVVIPSTEVVVVVSTEVVVVVVICVVSVDVTEVVVVTDSIEVDEAVELEWG